MDVITEENRTVRLGQYPRRRFISGSRSGGKGQSSLTPLRTITTTVTIMSVPREAT